jgi:hypothetical protein
MNPLLAITLASVTNTFSGVQPSDSAHFDWAAWITALATFALLLAGIIVAWVESRRHRFTQSIEMILRFEERFNSLDFLKQREAAAKCLKAKAYKNPTDRCSRDADEVLDFFETIGYLLRRRALDEKMVLHTFWHWIMGYYQGAEEHINEVRKSDQTVWEDFVQLHQRMESIQRFDVSNDEFLSEETSEPAIS